MNENNGHFLVIFLIFGFERPDPNIQGHTIGRPKWPLGLMARVDIMYKFSPSCGGGILGFGKKIMKFTAFLLRQK